MNPDEAPLSEKQKLDYIYQYIFEMREQTGNEGVQRVFSGTDHLWAINELQRRASNTPGRVVLAGVMSMGDEEPHLWQQEANIEQLFSLDWSENSRILEALSHPVRLRILQAILNGSHTVQEFTALPSIGTTGQTYHHLRDLMANGWVKSSRRNHYEIPPNRAVPLLVAVLCSFYHTTD